jgi:hypothetical protein
MPQLQLSTEPDITKEDLDNLKLFIEKNFQKKMDEQ